MCQSGAPAGRESREAPLRESASARAEQATRTERDLQRNDRGGDDELDAHYCVRCIFDDALTPNCFNFRMKNIKLMVQNRAARRLWGWRETM